ncbi:hypothetical protein CHAB381_1326 [Campylobacter hominis ATCC BAA-381]|uniref:Uncharacterized protein n=1 Tax=Campylobacter hominis (strain ATCC BAA-381 / DSM 21671 / CCUG 45161 / LMG 19568 / NCTC 13146 / CH001A) TaxID=360107 RepID=A7I2Y5_CAMHC|nr:hypothetical protein CHAB381_1326 [Campylobacter hominis ATCC BAA-381]
MALFSAKFMLNKIFYKVKQKFRVIFIKFLAPKKYKFQK